MLNVRKNTLGMLIASAVMGATGCMTPTPPSNSWEELTKPAPIDVEPEWKTACENFDPEAEFNIDDYLTLSEDIGPIELGLLNQVFDQMAADPIGRYELEKIVEVGGESITVTANYRLGTSYNPDEKILNVNFFQIAQIQHKSSQQLLESLEDSYMDTSLQRGVVHELLHSTYPRDADLVEDMKVIENKNRVLGMVDNTIGLLIKLLVPPVAAIPYRAAVTTINQKNYENLRDAALPYEEDNVARTNGYIAAHFPKEGSRLNYGATKMSISNILDGIFVHQESNSPEEVCSWVEKALASEVGEIQEEGPGK